MHNRQLPVQLPIWPEKVRGGPNPFLRSALFAGVPSRFRKILETRKSAADEPEGVMVAAQQGISIRYTGTQLNQYDADVFFEVLHRARRSPLGEVARFSGCNFLRSIGRGTSESEYQDLDTALRRLKRGLVDVKWTTRSKRLAYTGSLLDDFERDLNTKEYCVSLSPKIKTLFESSSFTHIEWDERQRLLRNPLAQWLHSYYSTHAKPFSVSIAFLQQTSGQESARPRDFAQSLRRALNILQTELGWSVEWLEGNLVKITRSPSNTQIRHLGRKAARKQSLEIANRPRSAPPVLRSSPMAGTWLTHLSDSPAHRDQAGEEGLVSVREILSAHFR